MPTALPLVLCLSGHDPTGGAGIHADLEAVAALGGHALTVVTAQTVQDTRDVARVAPVAPILIAAQIEALIADCDIAAIKVGLLGDAAQLPVIAAAAQRLRVPLVLDPVLRAGGGSALANAATVAAMRTDLFPLTTVLTPNAAEARRLAPGAATPEACAQALLAAGCANVLVTGGDEPGDDVVNTWHRSGSPPRAYRWPRLPETFHGAGCTLAAAIAALLAQGRDVGEALVEAQTYTQRSLHNARRIGHGRRIPGRLP
ncbi:MAG: hydroxymethylpyrimidine/phosphomethylpyrimidine kinase [Nevskiaceae bacterium]|nr:MAG: hydroxymethylpyrimidine/phosphomethylpyrimidine kinase [Nevskiaceae bacterium]